MKQKNSPAEILQDKKDKLDWQNFNFLENMLVFCAVPGRSVPKESGVHFRITFRFSERIYMYFISNR